MSTNCDRTFGEELLTGHLDGVLTQADDQRVRLHLEDCPRCRGLIDELRETREATMTTRFALPADDQWNEAPRGLTSRLSLGLGWLLLIVSAVGVLGVVVGHLVTGGLSLTQMLLLFGGLGGGALLFLSVLIDRLKTLRQDPYRRVEK